MPDLHGIIYAYHSSPELGELVSLRTSASLPFCSRYRLIDFALSSMTNAGVRDVSVIMQRSYHSLLDHLGSGKDWDLSRLSGGLTLLPPFGLFDSQFGEYRGCMEALSSIRTYIREIKQNNIILYRGDLAANLDLRDIFETHSASGCDVTAVCADKNAGCTGKGIRFVPVHGTSNVSNLMLFAGAEHENALPSLEVYIIKKNLLLDLIDWCRANGKIHFHRDALVHYLDSAKSIGLYIHKGYAARICSIMDYYTANMDMLKASCRNDLFSDDKPVYTKGRSSVSTYYGDMASAKNSLVADGCYIEGELENCVLFRSVRVHKGAKLKNCVIMQDSVIGENANLNYVISDKLATFSDGLLLSGNEHLPITVPKWRTI